MAQCNSCNREDDDFTPEEILDYLGENLPENKEEKYLLTDEMFHLFGEDFLCKICISQN